MQYTIIGGEVGRPLDLTIGGELPITVDKLLSNIATSKRLGLPTYRDAKPHPSRKLAVVGGGPSIHEYVDELRAFDGEVWAINGALGWCRDHGIPATLISADPHPIVLQWAKGAKRAFLESGCDPTVFDLLRDAEVYLYDSDTTQGGIASPHCTVMGIPHMACRIGFRGVRLYGCESSYPPKTSHAYMDEGRTQELIITCGGHDYLTAPDFYVQAVALAKYIRDVPEFISEGSGGLLRALVADPEFHIKWISDDLARSLTPISKAA